MTHVKAIYPLSGGTMIEGIFLDPVTASVFTRTGEAQIQR